MKVTRDMLHKELQSSYWALKLSSKLLMNRVGIKMINRISARSKGKDIEGLQCGETSISSNSGGPAIRLRIFRPLHYTGDLPGMLYIHGGGLMMGNPEDYLDIVKRFIDKSPCVIIAPDYRKAPDAPYPAAFNDCYDTLLWMDKYAGTLGIMPNKLIVAGHSAGGGLAAAVTLKATDTGEVKIAFQMPIYPMIDDRQNSLSAKENNAPGWNAQSNKMGWSAYLQGLMERGEEIPPYAAAARARDFSKLPPTITFVGDIEPFRDETLEYVDRLLDEGIAVEFRIFEGCIHAFEVLFPKLEVSKEAWSFLLSSYCKYLDAYVYSPFLPTKLILHK
ncbi:alpha/beta hydrolase [Pedobacter psychrodurus]|uniref:alpha/beta hydrolase n=1 Tax=Pedobacter psychrodurus TaxID=2530456 RepID=UPI002931285C|nr:alpha/beta hydrolase [Pedobacter psychrodurus]